MAFQLYNAYEEDFGTFTCEASNKYGKAKEHMELYESSIPICPPLCGDTNLNSGLPVTKSSLTALFMSILGAATAAAL